LANIVSSEYDGKPKDASTVLNEKSLNNSEEQQKIKEVINCDNKISSEGHDDKNGQVNGTANTNGHVLNGTQNNNNNTNSNNHSNNSNSNNNNRKYPKQRWVPLEIELPKQRTKRNRSPRRRRVINEYANDDSDWYSNERPPRSNRRQRPHGTSYRGGRGGNSSAGSNIISRPPIRSTRRGNPRHIAASDHQGKVGGEAEFTDFLHEYSQANKMGSEITQFMMPFLGTYYFNGLPSAVNMDSGNLKDCIKKQM